MASSINPLPSLIQAAAWDAANARMRNGGRQARSRGDYNAAASTQRRLVEACYGQGIRGQARYTLAHALERAGRLTMQMPARKFFAVLDDAERMPV